MNLSKCDCGSQHYRNSLLTVFVWTCFFLISFFFFWIFFDLCWRGLSQISFRFLIEEPESAGRAGGIAPILVSTFFILGICLGVCIPIGLGTAIFLAEFTTLESRFGKLVRFSLEVLAGVPSIVFGLFGNAFFCVYLKMGFSILSGGLTLACMALPLFIRSAEEGIRAVHQEYRLGAYALGMKKGSVLFYLLLPLAVPSLLVGLALGIGRALAETAALIFTSGYVSRMPESFWDSGRALSIHIYDLSMNVSGGERNAYATALVLIILLLSINGIVSWLSKKWFRRYFFSENTL